jgi:leucyl aminopeptidase
MTDLLQIDFAPLTAPTEPVVVALAGEDLAFGSVGRDLNTRSGNAIMKAAEAADFKGKAKSHVELLAPPKLDAARLFILGAGRTGDAGELDWINLGGTAVAHAASRKARTASLIAEVADSGDTAAAGVAALLAYGAKLRHYSFDKYLTKKNGAADSDASANGEAKEKPASDGLNRLVVHCADPDKARAAFKRHEAVAAGVHIARDLVNEPANMLGPVEFAERVQELERIGVEVEILDVEQISALKMGCLLAVGQGSVRPTRVCVMMWHGAKSKRAKPVCFVGKGVVFDTGGISIKPAQGMEDMKGDMGGAACVTGLMYALAARKANVNAVGIIGCVENMPSGSATRPGDIVTSMSGQTVEILNTDAEGRLVLADVMHYAQDRFKPRFVIDLATLTGAIMVALGKEYAGLYSNDEKLAAELLEASKATGEKVWRMPLDKAYDKLIDSKNADMKNIGGRWAGSCTAAQFLQRFIKDTPWAHIDVAGTAMASEPSEINRSWGSGWGVRLLDRLVADKYEKG